MIEKYREEIDAVDVEIVKLINRRFEIARKIGEWKNAHNLPAYVPERESILYDKLAKLAEGGLASPANLRAIYREIMSGAKQLEKNISVAFLGPLGTYSHQAAAEIFGHGPEWMPGFSIEEVFRLVESGRACYGCVPVENSTEGVVNPTLDSFIDSELFIINEFSLRIRHQLIGRGRFEDVKRVYSHPQVLGQCRKFLQNYLPQAEQIELASSVQALGKAAGEDGAAALAGKAAAELYDMPVIRANVEDNLLNTTRFLVIGQQKTKPSGNDKTSICFALRDRAGALYDALDSFRKNDISMSMIESRPLKKGNWEYYFFVDIAGHLEDEKVKTACEELSSKCTFFKIFGSYPKGKEPAE